ncbi:unnamed protein product [Withania somnifera]
MRNPSSSRTKVVTPCCTKIGLKRGPWTPEEDEILTNYVSKEGEGRWRTLPKKAGLLRCGKSCRLRWMNYLRPSVKRGHISEDEEDLILRLHRLLGNRWSLIAGRIPGRTDNEIKNYWNTHLTKKLMSQGIDPRTHKPLISKLSNPNSSSDENRTITNQANSSSSSKLPNLITVTTPDIPKFQMEQLLSCPGEITSPDQNVRLANYDDGCTDDIFSSFFNSLINEDMFMNSQNQQIHATLQDFDPLLASSTPNNPKRMDE